MSLKLPTHFSTKNSLNFNDEKKFAITLVMECSHATYLKYVILNVFKVYFQLQILIKLGTDGTVSFNSVFNLKRIVLVRGYLAEKGLKKNCTRRSVTTTTGMCITA